jgi:hypothetical protein
VTAGEEIVARLIESDLDPKQYAMDLPKPAQFVEVWGSWGKIKLGLFTGAIVSYEPSADASTDPNDPNHENYLNIVKFDIDELTKWLVHHTGSGLEAGDSFDIVDIGYWEKDGEYVTAELDHRRHTFLDEPMDVD